MQQEKSMPWWVWLVGGLGLLMFELVTPGLLVFLFLGASALVVGIIAATGIGLPLWAELMTFSVLSVLTLPLARGPILVRLNMRPRGHPGVDTMIDEIAVPTQDLAPGAVGQGELRGTVWMVRNDGTADILAGTRCRVVCVDGITLGITV